MNKAILLLIVSLFTINAAKAEGKCRALALEGGGDRGAYHAGAMSKFYDMLPTVEYQYDFCTGISAGSMNCAAWALFEKGQEKEQVAYMNQTWDDISMSDVYREWPGIFPIVGLLDGLLFKPGLFDNTPLRNFLKNILDHHTVTRNISVGATDLDGGFLQRFYSMELDSEADMINAVVSSASIEVFFPHADWNNSSYGDGGLMTLIDMEGAIDHCINQGYAQEDIILDAIFCLGSNATVHKDEHKATTMGILSRSLDIAAKSFGNSTFTHAYDKYPDVDYRYFIVPPLGLENDLFMEFNHEKIMAMQADGAAEAERIINLGPNFKKVMEGIYENKDQMKTHEAMRKAYYDY